MKTYFRATIERINGSRRIFARVNSRERLNQLITNCLANETATKRIIIETKEYDDSDLITKETKEYFYEW